MSGIAGMPEFARDAQLEPQPAESDRVVRAVVLGAVAALAGAAVWVVVGAVTKHEIGFVAVGVGYLVSVSMSRVRATWNRLPVVAAAIALVAVVVGDVVLDVVLQAQYEDVALGEAFGTVATDLSLAKDIVSAYFSPIDLLFWPLAASVAYRGVKASVLAAATRPQTPPQTPPQAPPPVPPVTASGSPYGPTA
jgi:hypothetical protein